MSGEILMRPATAILVLAFASAAVAGPSEAVAAAYADAKALPALTAPQYRYLTTYAMRREDKEAFYLNALRFWTNSLSRESEPVPFVQVSPDLYRVALLDYQWDARTWERLADVERWFHQKQTEETIETEDYGHYEGQRFVVTEKRPTGRKTTKTINASAFWLNPADIAGLINLTQSQVPIVRADWFIFQTGIQRDKQVGYYDFLGLGNKEADFLKLIAADKEAARRVRKEIAATLARSGVALQNRGILRQQSITGPYWFTQDYKTSTDKQNTLQLLDGDTEPPAGDASEQYGTLPNGLPAYWLQDAKGNRQNVVPPDIAHDRFATGNDLNIYAGKSCATCHAEIIRPIDDYARRLYRGAIKLQSVDYAKFVRLRQLYLSDLEARVKADQAEFAAALKRVNGLSPAENAKAFGQAWDAYAERDLSPADVARELGYSEKVLVEGLKKYSAAAGQVDPVLAGLLQAPPVPLRREHVDEAVALFYLAMKGYVQP